MYGYGGWGPGGAWGRNEVSERAQNKRAKAMQEFGDWITRTDLSQGPASMALDYHLVQACRRDFKRDVGPYGTVTWEKKSVHNRKSEVWLARVTCDQSGKARWLTDHPERVAESEAAAAHASEAAAAAEAAAGSDGDWSPGDDSDRGAGPPRGGKRQRGGGGRGGGGSAARERPAKRARGGGGRGGGSAALAVSPLKGTVAAAQQAPLPAPAAAAAHKCRDVEQARALEQLTAMLTARTPQQMEAVRAAAAAAAPANGDATQ